MILNTVQCNSKVCLCRGNTVRLEWMFIFSAKCARLTVCSFIWNNLSISEMIHTNRNDTYRQFSPYFIPGQIYLNMEVNSTVDCLSNCTPQFGSNCDDPFYECMDSYPGNAFTGFYIVLNVILFLPLNCWILRLVWRSKGVVWSDFVILNQSVAEIISEIALTIFLSSSLLNKKVVVMISNYLCSTFLVGRPVFQTVFCVERYLAVVHPLVYLKYTKAPKAKVLFVGLVWLVIMMLGWHTMDSHPKLPLWLFFGIYLGTIVVCSLCSLMILWILKRPKPGDGNEKEGAYQLKRKAFVAVTVILFTLVLGYGTVSCVIILRDQLPYDIYCFALGLSWWTLLPSSAIQPYLYLSKINKLPCIKNLFLTFLEMITSKVDKIVYFLNSNCKA